ncbi:MAG: L,D-transpeptidase family protein [Anaerovoracaceae bacterium]|jgi:glucan-binding YG repeat protein
MNLLANKKKGLAVLALCFLTAFCFLSVDTAYADSASGASDGAQVTSESTEGTTDAAEANESSDATETQGFTTDDEGKLYYDGDLYTGEYNGLYYQDGKLFTGTYNGLYYKKGVKYTGFHNSVYYKNGVRSTKNGIITVNGKKYYVKNGKKATGFYKSLYYYKSGVRSYKTGFVTYNGKKYCLKKGKKLTGIYKSHYYKKGRPAKGLVKVGSGYYYAVSGGKLVKNSFRKIGKYHYYFGSKGRAYTGWHHVHGIKRYFGKSGKMYTGTKRIGKRYYRFYSNGAVNKLFAHTYSHLVGKSSRTKYIIVVNRRNTKVLICKKYDGVWKPLHFWTCTVGKSSTPTPAGTFTIGYRGTHFGENHGYTCWYYTQITGSYLFHSVLYQPYSKSAIQDGRLGGHYSHGCIRLYIGNAKWIYKHIPRHTKVIIY